MTGGFYMKLGTLCAILTHVPPSRQGCERPTMDFPSLEIKKKKMPLFYLMAFSKVLILTVRAHVQGVTGFISLEENKKRGTIRRDVFTSLIMS